MEENKKVVEETTKEVDQNAGLMKKTKKQLVEIIFRKDAVEVSSMNKLKEAENRSSEYLTKIGQLKKELNYNEKLVSDFRAQLEACKITEDEMYSKLYKLRMISYASVAIGVVGIIVAIIF